MKKELTKLEIDCESIRKDIKECGKLYITVAYKVYELYIYEIYKEKYKNIVECCEKEFFFKKSTTYRFLGIVEKFGEKENGIVTYRSLMKYDKFSYSQLTEMLALSDAQRKKVTPDMTISKIRDMKKTFSAPVADSHKVEKVPMSGKVKASESEPDVIEILPEQLQVVADSYQIEKVPISGKAERDLIGQLKKENEQLIYRNSILETDTKMLRLKVQQLEEKISQLEAEKKQTF